MKRVLAGLTRRLAHLWASHFLRNVALVAGGTAAAQVITVASSPFITRIYEPEAFGIVNVFMSTLAFITPILSLSYSMAIVLPSSDKEAIVILKLSFIISIIITAISSTAFGIFHQQIASLVGFTAASTWLLLAPIFIFFSSMIDPVQQWLIRKRRFRDVSCINLTQSILINTMKISIGSIIATAPVLLIVSVLDRVLYTFLLWLSARPILLRRQDRVDADVENSNLSLKEVAFRYRDFAFYRTPQVWLNSASVSIPSLILAAALGPAAAGFYAIARTVLSLPISLISNAVGTVFLPRLVEAAHGCEKLRPLIIKSTVGLALVGLLPFGIVIIFGPWLFSLTFGVAWNMAGEYARWLSLWIYFSFINVPSVQAIPLLDLQGRLLAYEVIVVFLRTGSLLLGVMAFKSELTAIALLSVTGALGNIFLIGSVIFLSGARLREGVRAAGKG
jgi:O-antigen/teichoic acid export membrane protein